MNLDNLRVFTIVAEELNISRSAGKLYSSQQAVSDVIRRLEREYDVRLFERSPRLYLTHAGETFLRFAKDVLEQERRMVQHLDDIAEQRRGILRVGASPIRSRMLFPEILPQYHRLYPNVELDVTVASASVLENKLEQGRLDTIVCLYHMNMQRTMDIYLTIQDQFGAIVPATLAPEGFKQTDAEVFLQTDEGKAFLSGLPILLSERGTRVRSNTDRYFKRLKIRPNILLELRDLETLLRLSAHGMGVTWAFRDALRYFLPSDVEEELLLYAPVSEFDPESLVIVGGAKNRNPLWPVKAFLSVMNQIKRFHVVTSPSFPKLSAYHNMNYSLDE